MNRFHIHAIAIGLGCSVALDIVGGATLLGLFGGSFEGSLAAEALNREITATLPFLFVSLAYGTFTTVVGGYIAARRARSHPYFNALAVGVIGIALGLLLPSGDSTWVDVLGLLSNPPAAVLGGHLFARQRRPAP